MSRNRLVLMLFGVLALALVVGCGSDDSADEAQTSSGETNGAVAACSPESLRTFKQGVLTIATDSPTYPPYVEDDNPTSGKGFESALGYAIAGQLGFNDSEVQWVTVPFNDSIKPGPKNFDFDLNQISITPKREKNVSFSVPYYEASQAVLVMQDGDLESLKGLAQLKDRKIGVQEGTTSLSAVESQIQPSKKPQVFKNSSEVVDAFKNEKVEAIVVDLPTAIQLRDSELTNSVIAGQFKQDGGDKWGALMTKDSAIKDCVDQAIETLREDGTLAELEQQWMRDSAEAPTFG